MGWVMDHVVGIMQKRRVGFISANHVNSPGSYLRCRCKLAKNRSTSNSAPQFCEKSPKVGKAITKLSHHALLGQTE
jgi:hypothetical protein